MNDSHGGAPWGCPAVGLYSDEWFRRVRSLTADIELPDIDLTVEYTCTDWPGGLVHHQVFAGGRLRAWVRGSAAIADLRLRQTVTSHTATLTRVGLGNSVLGETEIVGPDSRVAAPPPLDEVVTPWGRDLPLVPTAPDVVVQQHLTESAFGTVSTVYEVQQGRVVGARLGTIDDADVSVVRPFGDAMAERAGELDVLDSVRRGQVEGDYLAVSMFLGIYESDECRAARQALTTPAVGRVVRLGALLGSDGWRAVGRGLAEGSGEMRSVP